MATLEELMSELQALGGVSAKPRASQRDDLPTRISRLFEQDGGMAARESLKGKIDVLAKRMEGVSDFLSDGNMPAAQIAMEKIIKDASETLQEMGASKKKEAAAKKKDAEDAAQDQEGEPQKAPKQQQAQQQAPQSPQATPAQTPQTKGVKENAVYAGGMLLERVEDPFGMGNEFKDYIAQMSGVKKN